MVLVTEGVDPLLGAGFFLVTAGAAEGGIEAVLVQRLFQTLGLHHVGVHRAAVGEGTDALRHPFGVHVHQQVQIHLLDHALAEAVHLAEFPAGVHMQHREWQAAGIEGLACQMQHDGGVLADGIQHYRVLELGGNLTDDVDAFGFQLFQMGQFFQHGVLTMN